jgi:hypothetical protein
MSKVKATILVGETRCHIHVVGMTFPCPLCGYVVQSGEQHECSRPSQPVKRAPRRSRGDRRG